MRFEVVVHWGRRLLLARRLLERGEQAGLGLREMTEMVMMMAMELKKKGVMKMLMLIVR